MTNPSDVYRLFFKPGEITEIRAYGLAGSGPWRGRAWGEGIVFGYFDNAEAFGKAAMGLEKAKAPGIYFVLNPIVPMLFARSANELKAAAGKKARATQDRDILCLRWLYLDLDPMVKMPDGSYDKVAQISSSDEELKAAIDLRNKISKWIKKNKGPQGIPGISGNGAHLLLKLPDYPNTEENVALIRDMLRYIKAEFDPVDVEVDQKVFNPSRICKLYGTTARKGSSVKDRPHRKSFIEPAYLELKADGKKKKTPEKTNKEDPGKKQK